MLFKKKTAYARYACVQGMVVVCVCRDGRFTYRVFQYAAAVEYYLRGVTMNKVACRRATQREGG